MFIHTILSQIEEEFDKVAYDECVYGNPTFDPRGFYKCKEYIKTLVTRIVEEAQREERKQIYNYLMDKQEFVTYKKDGGHGVAVPMSWIIDLGTKLQKMKG